MIRLIQGTIVSTHKNSAVIMTESGIGYELSVSTNTLAGLKQGDTVILHTYLKVSDSAMELYGFSTPEEKNFFALLLSVSGVGPKSAMHILSLGSLEKTKQAIARQDVKYLTAVQGMGKKTAERIVVELKGKVGSAEPGTDIQTGGPLGEVIDGLVSMGYSKEEAKEAVERLQYDEHEETEQLLKRALKNLAL